ncbi:hypothetical protein OIU85_027253 [Salix viminalis]|uniref:Uncharacterized protein n=1 Tax=Salix viminalis TaxID=40686 RepID=A0A9Q0TAE1_SALVM|nr:hypothetical protein OIU85_027253 [Salix viminalis]
MGPTFSLVLDSTNSDIDSAIREKTPPGPSPPNPAEEEGGGSRNVVVGDERGRYERILGVEILEMEFGFGVELFSVEEDEERVRAGGLVEVKKREINWSSKWIMPDLDWDWRERSSVTRSSESAVAQWRTEVKRRRGRKTVGNIAIFGRKV